MATHTFAILEVTQVTYEEIAKKLLDAGYTHAFHEVDGQTVIDMHGVALKHEEPPPLPKDEVLYERKSRSYLDNCCKVLAKESIGEAYQVITMPNGEEIPNQIFTRVSSIVGQLPYAIVKVLVDLRPRQDPPEVNKPK